MKVRDIFNSNFAVGNLKLSDGKLQVPKTFKTHDAAVLKPLKNLHKYHKLIDLLIINSCLD